MVTFWHGIRLPTSVGGWIHLALSVVGLAGYVAFLLYPFAQLSLFGVTLSSDLILGIKIGTLLMLGMMILVVDEISTPIAKAHNAGWLAIVAGLYFALGRSLGPMFKEFVKNVTPAQITFLAIGVLLIAAGYLIVRRRNP